jgi:hypothetical protein
VLPTPLTFAEYEPGGSVATRALSAELAGSENAPTCENVLAVAAATAACVDDEPRVIEELQPLLEAMGLPAESYNVSWGAARTPDTPNGLKPGPTPRTRTVSYELPAM